MTGAHEAGVMYRFWFLNYAEKSEAQLAWAILWVLGILPYAFISHLSGDSLIIVVSTSVVITVHIVAIWIIGHRIEPRRVDVNAS